jgi:hypothetical protein
MRKKITRLKHEHHDPKFNKQLEELFERIGGETYTRTEFAEQFLGVSYATYCNWRSGRYPADDFTRKTVEAYAELSDSALKDMVKHRMQ